MDELKLPAPAKLNLFLTILGRRPDGYHDLQTVFQLLDFCDELSFSPDSDISLEVEGLTVPVEDNLVLRAAHLLANAPGSDPGAVRGSVQGARIVLKKRIPLGAGLGGGSSDAASTLVGLNHLWGLGFPASKLAEIGAGLGADVPVFVLGHSAFAEGVGERLQPIDLPEKWYVVVHPGVSVSTAQIFNHPDLTRNGSPITIARFLEEGSSANACEPLVRRLFPVVDEAIRWLGQWGLARMTGTGASVFLEVPTGHEADEFCDEIVAAVPSGWSAFKAKGINESPISQLR